MKFDVNSGARSSPNGAVNVPPPGPKDSPDRGVFGTAKPPADP